MKRSVEEFCGCVRSKRGTPKYEERSGFARWSLRAGADPAYYIIDLNVGKWTSHRGYYEGFFGDEVRVTFLENYFLDPLNPTEDECVLFELEFGVQYPDI